MKYFYSLIGKTLRPEEVHAASNALRLFIFHVQLEKENILTSYFTKYNIVEKFIKLFSINSNKILSNSL